MVRRDLLDSIIPPSHCLAHYVPVRVIRWINTNKQNWYSPFSEWLVNQHRDSAASYIGHENLLDYFALVENESKARVKFTLLEVTIL